MILVPECSSYLWMLMCKEICVGCMEDKHILVFLHQVRQASLGEAVEMQLFYCLLATKQDWKKNSPHSLARQLQNHYRPAEQAGGSVCRLDILES